MTKISFINHKFDLKIFSILIPLVILSCVPLIPIGTRPKNPQFKTTKEIQNIVISTKNKESIYKIFGKPYVESSNPDSIAYFTCIKTDKWVLWLLVPPIIIPIPYTGKGGLEYFQIIGFWFNSNGELIKQKIWNGRDSLWGGTVPNHVEVKQWLDKEAPKN